MPAALALGWYPTGEVWLPLQVDDKGRVVVDMSAINLDDLGDVRVPAPADQNFLYWDDVAGEWTYRILVDADIPAGIARDAEVAIAVAAEATARAADVDAEEAARITADTDHAALTTGVHGIQDIPLFSTEAKEYYIDAVGGDDSNGGEASDDAWKTWAHAILQLPIFPLHAFTFYIIGNLPEIIYVHGRFPQATILIRGSTTTPSNQVVSGFAQRYCNGDIRFRYLKSTGRCFILNSILHYYESVRDCEPQVSGNVGLTIESSIAGIYLCNFGTDLNTSCIAVYDSKVVSRDNSGNGTSYGLFARYNGSIGKRGTQPTGTTANENALDGGVIR